MSAPPTPLLIPSNLDSKPDVVKHNIRPHPFQDVEASGVDEPLTTNALATPIPKDNTSDDAQDESDFEDQGFQDEIHYLSAHSMMNLLCPEETTGKDYDNAGNYVLSRLRTQMA
jgi:hypothetical protein